MRRVLALTSTLGLAGCAGDGSACDVRTLGDVDSAERPPALVDHAAALAAANGAWTSILNGRTITMALSTDVDLIEVNLGHGLCSGGGGPGESSVQVDDAMAASDSGGECNLTTLDEDFAWCEFETAGGSWQINVDDGGILTLDAAAALVGGEAGDEGVHISDWTRVE